MHTNKEKNTNNVSSTIVPQLFSIPL